MEVHRQQPLVAAGEVDGGVEQGLRRQGVAGLAGGSRQVGQAQS